MTTATARTADSSGREPRTLGELEDLLRSVANGVTLVGVTILATVAAAIIERWNQGNRRLDEIAVQRYRRDMDADRWIADGAVGFGVFEGDVAVGDGQHRFAAQVASGKSQRYNLRVFTAHEAFADFVLTVDGGKNRSLADELLIFGVAGAPGAAALFERVTNAMQSFLGARPTRLSKQERMDFARRYVKPMKYALGLPKRTFKAHVLAAIVFAYAKRSKDVEELVAQLISGADLAGGSPALKLKNALGDLNDAGDARAKDRAMGLTLRAINDATTGKKTTTLYKAQADGRPVHEAITALVSAAAADAWTERQKRR